MTSVLERTARPDRLMDWAARRRPTASLVDRLPPDQARRLAERLLHRLHRDQLTVTDRSVRRPTEHVVGLPGGLHARLDIVDDRAYAAALGGGSAGLGRGYIEGWWDTDDLTTMLRVVVRNLGEFDELRNRLYGLTGWASDPVRRLLPRRDARGNRVDIATHYDIGNTFTSSSSTRR